MVVSPPVRLITLIGIYFSSLFAILQITKMLFEPQKYAIQLLLILVIGFVLFALSLFVRKNIPGRFLGKDLKFTLIYLMLSVSLSFFLLSFTNDNTKNLWQEYITKNEVVRTLSQSLMAVLIQFLIVFIAVFPVFIIWLFYTRKKGFLINLSVAGVYALAFLVLLPYLAATRRVVLWIDPAKVLDYFTDTLVPTLEYILYIVVNFMIGSIPLGWFSELFIGTLYKKTGHIRVK